MEKLIRSLKALGLSNYEAKAYLTLLNKVNLSAEELSKASNIPLPRVYSIVDELAGKGFVKVIEGRPRLFEAIEPDEALNSYTKYLEKLFEEDIKKRREEVLKNLPRFREIYWRSRLRISPEKLSEDITSLKDMETKTIEIINSASREVNIFTSHFKWFSKIENTLKSVVSRDVNIRVLMQIDDEDSAKRALKLLKMGVNVKNTYEAWYPTRGTIVDNVKLVYLIWVSSTNKRGKLMMYKPQYTENEGFIAVFKDAFESRWVKSRDPEDIIKKFLR